MKMPNIKQDKSILLDVDPSIIEKNVTIVKDWSMEDEVRNIMRTPDDTSVAVRPTPGFCVKTKLLKENKKAFINVCHTDAIPPPDDISGEELAAILASDERSSYRVPMSIGEPRTENDKSGVPAVVYDIAIGTKFLNKIEDSPDFRAFFISVIFEGLMNKYEIELDIDDHVILKNRKSIGNLQIHRIQKRIVESKQPISTLSKPLIQEMTPADYESAVEQKVTKDSNIAKKPIDFQLVKKFNSSKKEYLIAEFKVEKKVKSCDIICDVGEDRIIVEIFKNNQYQDIFLPCNVNRKTTQAVLDTKNDLFLVILETAN